MGSIEEERRQSLKAAEDIAKGPLYDPEGLLGLGGNFKGEGEPSAADKRRLALKDMARRIMKVENRKGLGGRGWDPLLQRWYPHESHEGGARTIAYGIKLSNGGPWADTALRQGYLTDEQAVQAVEDEAPRYYDNARRTFDKRYGEGAWDGLGFRQQSILADYEYGVRGGLASFPKLMQAAYEGDIDAMLRESPRYDAKKRPLGRNKVLAEDIESLRPSVPSTTPEKGE
jgi:hypothetical protein